MDRLPKGLSLLTLSLLLAALAAFAPAEPPAHELNLSITMVTGERSKDSSSETTTLTVKGDTLRYEQNYRGAHSSSRTPVKREYKLTAADRSALTNVMREKNLLVTRTVKALAQEDGPEFYFSLIIHSKMNDKEHTISISGLRGGAKLKQDRIYQDSVFLVEQLYRLMQRTDPSVTVPKLVY